MRTDSPGRYRAWLDGVYATVRHHDEPEMTLCVFSAERDCWLDAATGEAFSIAPAVVDIATGGPTTDDVANLMERQLEVLRERDALQLRIALAIEGHGPFHEETCSVNGAIEGIGCDCDVEPIIEWLTGGYSLTSGYARGIAPSQLLGSPA